MYISVKHLGCRMKHIVNIVTPRETHRKETPAQQHSVKNSHPQYSMKKLLVVHRRGESQVLAVHTTKAERKGHSHKLEKTRASQYSVYPNCEDKKNMRLTPPPVGVIILRSLALPGCMLRIIPPPHKPLIDMYLWYFSRTPGWICV